MLKWVFTLFMLGVTSAHASTLPFVGDDKLLHFSAGYGLADVVMWAEKRFEIRDPYALMPLMSVVALAAAKEGYDSTKPKGVWDWQDFSAVIAGYGVKLCFRY